MTVPPPPPADPEPDAGQEPHAGPEPEDDAARGAGSEPHAAGQEPHGGSEPEDDAARGAGSEPHADSLPRDTAEPHADLAALARRGRLLVMESVHQAGAGHVGGPLSAMDLLVALFTRVMRVRPHEPGWPERDRFILSKGHSAIGLYAAMALAGYFPVEELATFDAAGSRLQGHPDMTRLPELDASTGSLGQGISVGVGLALGAKLRGLGFHTWVMLGDGEMQEGQVWESVQVAAKYGLGNLTAIVDRNGMQQYGWPLRAGEAHRGDRRDPFGDVGPKSALEAFGWRVLEIDGHDFGQIIDAGEQARAGAGTGRPTAILATTVKGRGFSFTEGASSWHARAATADEVEAARAETASSDLPARSVEAARAETASADADADRARARTSEATR